LSVKEAPDNISVGIKYSMRDLICDVINYCTSKIKCIKIKNLKQRKHIHQSNFHMKFYLKDVLRIKFIV